MLSPMGLMIEPARGPTGIANANPAARFRDRNVRFWHKADILGERLNVCFWG